MTLSRSCVARSLMFRYPQKEMFIALTAKLFWCFALKKCPVRPNRFILAGIFVTHIAHFKKIAILSPQRCRNDAVVSTVFDRNFQQGVLHKYCNFFESGYMCV